MSSWRRINAFIEQIQSKQFFGPPASTTFVWNIRDWPPKKTLIFVEWMNMRIWGLEMLSAGRNYLLKMANGWRILLPSNYPLKFKVWINICHGVLCWYVLHELWPLCHHVWPIKPLMIFDVRWSVRGKSTCINQFSSNTIKYHQRVCDHQIIHK